MAMRQKPLSSRTRSSARPVYEDFHPSFERKENPVAVFLHIQLPGFTKERLNVTYTDAPRKLKVSGERPIEGNRWVRFRQEYSVPGICEAERLHSKFDKGVLTITMPKKVLTQVSPKQEVRRIQEETTAVPSKKAAATEPPKPEKDQDVSPSRRGSASVLPGPVEGPAELKPQKGQEETSTQRTADSKKSADEKGLRAVIPPGPVSPKEEVKRIQEETAAVPSKKAVAAEPLKPEKDQDVIPPKSTPSSDIDSTERGGASVLPVPVKGPAELKPQQGEEESSAQRTIDSRKPANEKGLRALSPPGPERMRESVPQKGLEEIVQKRILTMGKPQKGQEEIQPQSTKITTSGKQLDEKPQEEVKQKTTLTTVPKMQTDERNIVGMRPEEAEKEKILKKEVEETDGKPSKSRTPKNDVEMFIKREKEIRARKELVKAAEGSAPKAQEKEKETTGEDKGKHNEHMADTIGKGIKELAASASQAGSRIAEGKWNEEDKPLLVNMGVAALVIAALGAYISYEFASYGKP